ncbi:MAG: type II secretion system F family protein [Rhodocyclales bacterium]|nr:type II secretion system F family protein [Rhodocyclales bacterium]MBI5786238.1 type II secretion system F family protein [Rhodocyclales bacterium]
MLFRVKTMADAGGVGVLALQARDAEEAAALARRQGHVVLSVARGGFAPFGARAARFPLLLFSQELLALLESGISVVEAIETLAEKEARPTVRNALATILGRLREGSTLSNVLSEMPEHFPDLFVATIRASERTSDLDESLRRFIAYQTQLDALRSKLVSAAIYPLLLIGVGGLVIIFLLGFVVPRFAHIYEDMGGELPWLSQLLIEWGGLIEEHGLVALAALIGAGIGLYKVFQRPAIRARLGEMVWRLPKIGERLRVFHLARCYRTLGMLLRGGIPIVPALEMIEGLLAATLRPQLAKSTADVRQGIPISQAMDGHGLTTPVALRLLRVGEQAGNMGEMMERIATFHDEETARWTELVVRLFGPLLMLIIGVLIGIIVVLLYLPIFQLAENIR